MPQPETIPHAPDAETVVLSALLQDARAAESVFDLLRPDDFYAERNRRLFDALAQLRESGKPVTPVMLFEVLRNRGGADALGGASYLSELMGAAPSLAGVEHHAEIIADRSQLRRILIAARDVQALALSGKEAAAVQEEAERLVMATQAGSRGRIEHVGQTMMGVFSRMEAGEPDTLTGFIDLDHLTTGHAKGDLVIVAARPSMGKSSFAAQVAINIARATAKPVPVFTLESTREELVKRMLFSEARVDGAEVKRRGLEAVPDAMVRLSEAAAKLNRLPLFVDDQARTVREMAAHCRRLQKERGELGAIFVDYLGYIEGYEETESLVERIGLITRALKRLAKDCGCPVFLLCQLSRRVEERPDKKPMLSDLRDSGHIEQDADTVLLLYRPEFYFGPTMKRGKDDPIVNIQGLAEIIVAKHRNGATGDVCLTFVKEFTRFQDRSWREETGRRP